MIYGSICSGIEAATVAWHPLGWKAAFFSEIDAFPRAVLQHHYPSTPLHGDFTTIEQDSYAAIDLLVGGTPCQAFSVAGLRKGFADERGNLTLEFIRLAQRLKPRWLVWENVPGVLSIDGGRAFGSFLGGLAECGYGFAYRVLDAQHFGVPQRRRRVFVVGYLGDWRPPAAVLFERDGLRRDLTPSREKGEGATPILEVGARTNGDGYRDGDGIGEPGDSMFTLQASKVHGVFPSTGHTSHCLNAGGMGRQDYETETLITAIPIQDKATRYKGGGDSRNDDGSANGFGVGNPGDPFPTLGANDIHAVAVEQPYNIVGCGQVGRNHAYETEISGCLQHKGLAATGNEAGTPIQRLTQVRRLTPVECERLQGFPDVIKHAIIRMCINEEDKLELARCAKAPLAAPSLGGSRPVAARVLIDLERQRLQLLSPGRSPFSASIADAKGSFPLPMPVDVFVPLAALMTSTLASGTSDGKAGSLHPIRHSSVHWNGSVSVHLCGQEIEEFANDAARLMNAVNHCTKSITSEAGQNSLSYEQALRTLCCCVAAAISSYIPDEIRAGNSYDIDIKTVAGYTLAPYRGKPAADGNRYKALGNSMAVPVMRWIGERIQMVDNLRRAA